MGNYIRKREEGRRAFYEGGNPVALNPHMFEGHRKEWAYGWEQAKLKDQEKQKKTSQEQAEAEERKLSRITGPRWHCCGGIPLQQDQNCGACGDSYDD